MQQMIMELIIEQHTSHEIISGVQNRIQLWIKEWAQKIANNAIILPFYNLTEAKWLNKCTNNKQIDQIASKREQRKGVDEEWGLWNYRLGANISKVGGDVTKF